MTEKLFFSQDLITAWADDEKVRFDDQTLSISTPGGIREYKLTPAWRFLSVSGGGEDPNQLVGKILSQEEITEKGGDVYLNSCIIGETAYDVEPGYVAVRAEDEKSIEQLLMEYLAKTL